VVPNSGELGRSLTTTRDHYETPCCYYSHAKLARYLTSFTGEARYGDGLERVLLNTILGAIDPDDDGGYFYYADYQAGARKKYYQRKWPCCAGTLAQSAADYPLNLYFHDGRQDIFVNLYAGSEVRWRTGNTPVRLTQTTAYPASERIEIAVQPDAPAEFGVNLRIPGWLDRPAEIAVNGKRISLSAQPGRFARISRRWRQGDRIELTLPFHFRAVPVDNRHPDTVAVMRGPVMLVAAGTSENVTAPKAALESLQPAAGGNPLEFDCRTADPQGRSVRMRPFYQVQREPYTTYLQRT
jgi:DUF1680 family protein